jgi:zinc protease
MFMKTFSAIAIYGLLCGVALAFAQQQGKGIFPYPYQETVLDNGLKIVLVPMKGSGMVAYFSVVRTGSRDEFEPGHSGFAHFFEHMMFRGTKKYPGEVYDKLVTEMGADANAFTSNDVTCYHLEFAAGDLEKVMELESDRFQNLSYVEQAFKTEAGAILGEYLKSLSSPWMVLEEKLSATAFKKHTYRHTTIGFKEDIEAMPSMYEFSLSFFNRYYRPDNVVLLIVGDFNPESALVLVKKYYSGWGKGYVKPNIPAEPEQKGERRATADFNGKTLPILCMGYKALAFDPALRDMAACELAGQLLFGETSDLYKKLVLDEQRLQSLESDFTSNRDPSLMVVYAKIKDEKDVKTIKNDIDKAIQLFSQTPVDARKLDDLKSNMKYGFLMGLETPGDVAERLVRFLSLTGLMDSVNALYENYDHITPEDVQKAVQKYLIRDKRTVVLVKGN